MMDYISLIIGVASLVPAFIALIIMNNKSKKSRRDIEKNVADIKAESINFVDLGLDFTPDGKAESENIQGEAREKVIVGLLKDHHEQALMQASVQFWFSLFAAVVGFAFIIIMIVNNTHDMEWFDYVVKILPGVIIEAISALFFQQSKEIRDRATEFFNRLREDDKIDRSIDIAESITDESLKSEVKAKIALHISGIAGETEKE